MKQPKQLKLFDVETRFTKIIERIENDIQNDRYDNVVHTKMISIKHLLNYNK